MKNKKNTDRRKQVRDHHHASFLEKQAIDKQSTSDRRVINSVCSRDRHDIQHLEKKKLSPISRFCRVTFYFQKIFSKIFFAVVQLQNKKNLTLSRSSTSSLTAASAAVTFVKRRK